MPTSAPYAIPVVIRAVRQVQPRSILDVGAGFGKCGLLFREYLDVWNATERDESDASRRETWITRSEAVEIYPNYLTPVHEYVYDRIHVGNIPDLIDNLGTYDLVFMGDVLEHFPREQGHALIRALYAHADRCVLLTWPTHARRRDGLTGNPAEAHHSAWSRRDFRGFERVAYTTVEDRADVCALVRPPHEPPFLVGCLAARRRTGWKGRLTSLAVRTLGPRTASALAGACAGRRIALRAE